MFRDLTVVFAIASVVPTVLFGEYALAGGHRGSVCALIEDMPALGDVPTLGGNYCTPSYFFAAGMWFLSSSVAFALLSVPYFLFLRLPGWLVRPASDRRDRPISGDHGKGIAADTRDGVATPPSTGGAAFAIKERLKRHGLWIAVLAAIIAAIWIGDRLVDGEVGGKFLCASKVAVAQFGDVAMLDGGYCRPRWGSAIGVFLTVTFVLFVALSVAYFVFYFIPVSLHHSLLRLEREAESDRYTTD